ncbi:integral membrane protein [Amniculicola lignicola CBS 123094]|uniref:Integral membrane protein n=1 Tax=Amniculicola lignicola CBS 123094 TaxID=1392246 RepID=A0A6A5X039_9PLEO|nr:integral membrane protein [Amniculicola lignicola CBS 123094]
MMIVSRAFSLFFRFSEFVCAAVVLGIMAHFLNDYDKTHVGPLSREIYTTVIASLSVLFSVIWMIPTTHQFLHYPIDLFLSAAWFAAFGVLVNWIGRFNCGGAWYWGGIRRWNSYCGQWRAAEAFSFIGACFWFASFLLGVYVYHKLRQPMTLDGTRSRRRWHRSGV